LVIAILCWTSCLSEGPWIGYITPAKWGTFEVLNGKWSRNLKDLKYDPVSDIIYVTIGSNSKIFWFYSDNYQLDWTSFIVNQFYQFSYAISTVKDANNTYLWTLGTMMKYDNYLTNSNSIPVLASRVTFPNMVDKNVTAIPFIDLYSIAQVMDLSNPDAAIGYFVGWRHLDDGNVDLVVCKVQASKGDGRGLTLSVVETLVLSSNDYTLFSSERKPPIFYDPSRNQLIVVIADIYSYIYVIGINSTGNMNLLRTTKDYAGFTSVCFDKKANALYFGTIASLDSTHLAYLRAFSVNTSSWFGEKLTLTLDGATNPSHLILDEFSETSTLYVGFGGGPAIMKVIPPVMNGNTWIPIGYIGLPDSLVHISSGVFVNGYAYFSTNENNGKLFRVHENNFCPRLCPLNSICNAGVCGCEDGYILDDDKGCIQVFSSALQQTDGLAITFIVLFVIALVAAFIGFAMFFRANRGRTVYSQLSQINE